MSRPGTLPIYAHQLAQAITLTKPFVSKDDTLPMLCGYQVHVIRDALYVAATDRYTLGVARIAASGEQQFPAGFSAFIPRMLADRALQIFKTPRGQENLPLTIAVQGSRVAIEEVSKRGALSMRLVEDLAGVKPPAYRLIVTDLVKRWNETQKGTQPPGPVGLNVEFLARFAVIKKALGRYVDTVVRQTAVNKPIMFTATDGDVHFFGLQMPVRLPIGGEIRRNEPVAYSSHHDGPIGRCCGEAA